MSNEGSNITTTSAAAVLGFSPDLAKTIFDPRPFLSIFFVLGLMTIIAHAWQRFNEPTFPTKDTLPHTVTPLRYLFLRPAYRKARHVYVSLSVCLYCLFVAPGAAMAQLLDKMLGIQGFPPEAWPLVVALVMAGLLPNANIKFLTLIEDYLRRLVHESFLVPDGVARTIGILEDANFSPREPQLQAVPSPLREELRRDLKRPHNSLAYRWARARMLMESLNQMGAGVEHPLVKSNFDPFQDDFEEISAAHKALAQDISAGADKEAHLVKSVDKLLRRIYAYISWGVRHQVDSQEAADDTLAELGFEMPETGGRRLFDVVAWPIALVAVITATYSFTVDLVNWWSSDPRPDFDISGSVLNALISTAATSVMYGCALFVALDQRVSQIEQKVWRQGSPTRLVPIIFKAGFTTCLVIVITTILLQLTTVVESLPLLAKAIKTWSPVASTGTQWNFIPAKLLTSLPWFTAGAMVSVLLAYFLGGDVRRTDRRQQVLDAVAMGITLTFAAAAAQLMKNTVAARLLPNEVDSIWSVPIVGFAGFLCGAAIGFTVPSACRENLVNPRDPKMASALQNLRDRARRLFGSSEAAETWIFTPHRKLGGITPAEGVQYKGIATGVLGYLRDDAKKRKPSRLSGPLHAPSAAGNGMASLAQTSPRAMHQPNQDARGPGGISLAPLDEPIPAHPDDNEAIYPASERPARTNGETLVES